MLAPLSIGFFANRNPWAPTCRRPLESGRIQEFCGDRETRLPGVEGPPEALRLRESFSAAQHIYRKPWHGVEFYIYHGHVTCSLLHAHLFSV